MSKSELLKLPPLREIDYRNAANEHFEKFVGQTQDAVRRLPDVIEASMVVSIDMMWPSILQMARKLRQEGPVEAGGWRMAAVDAAEHEETFKMEALGEGGGGYLFNLRLDPILSEDGKAKLEEAQAGFKAEMATIEDPAERRRRWASAIVNPSQEENAITEDPANYLHKDACTLATGFTCVAFTGDDYTKPPGFTGEDSTASKFAAALKAGFDGYQDGTVFTYRPNRRLDNPDRDPSIGTSKGISNVCSSIFVMERLSNILSFMKFSPAIWKRTDEHAHVRYEQYSREAGCLLKTIGAGAVFADGGHFGESSFAMAMSFAGRSAAADVAKRTDAVMQLANYLEEAGHTSHDKEYDCNDGDDFGFVTRESDGSRSIFIRTQHNQYRVNLTEEEGRFALLEMAIIAERDFESPMPDAGDRGFLGYYAPDTDGTIIPYDADLLSSDRLRGFNDLVFTIESMHCCWEEEFGPEQEPNSL